MTLFFSKHASYIAYIDDHSQVQMLIRQVFILQEVLTAGSTYEEDITIQNTRMPGRIIQIKDKRSILCRIREVTQDQ